MTNLARRGTPLRLLEMAEHDREELARDSRAFGQEKQAELAAIKESLNRLTSLYVAQEIDRDLFLSQKEEILPKKKALQEALERNERGLSRTWLEPFTKWVNTAKTLAETAQSGSLQEKKRVAVQVFGSNLFLDSKKARGSASKPWSLVPENRSLGEMVPRLGLEPRTN
jgi:hypothetical protein